MNETRGLGREALVYSVAKVLNGLLGFGAIYVFTRLLLPAEYGYYWLVYTAADLIVAFAGAWINQTMKRNYVGLSPDELPSFMGRIAGAYIITAVALMLLAAAASLVLWAVGWPPVLPWLVLLVGVPVSAMTFVQWLFRIRRQPWDWMLTQVSTTGGRLILGWLLLVFVARTGQLLLLAYALAALAAALWGFYRLRERCVLDRDSFSWRSLRGLLDYGFPIALANGSLWLMAGGGRLVLGMLTGKAAVGVYSAAQQLTRQLLELSVAPVQIGADPVTISVYERDGRGAAARYLKNWLGLVLLLGVGVALSLYLLRGPVVGALLDPAYREARELLGYLGPAMVFLLMMPVATKSHELAKHTAQLSYYFLGVGILNIALNFALIPWMAEAGAALSLMLSYFAISAISYAGGQRLLPWGIPWRIGLLTVVPLLALVAANATLPQPSGLPLTFAYGVGYVASYLALVVLLGWLGRRLMREEVEFVKLLFSGRRQ